MTTAHPDTADCHLRRIVTIADEALAHLDQQQQDGWANTETDHIQSTVIGEFTALKGEAQAALIELSKRPSALRYGALGYGGGQS